MYIGQFNFNAVTDVWAKNTAYPVLLFQAGPDNSLVPVPDEDGNQMVVNAINIVSTLGYKSDADRYCMVTEINGTYWVVSAEC